jgi:gamma-glutamylcyclotransferase (GGCT)/AIG2-like uncharacterized protein YtfP
MSSLIKAASRELLYSNPPSGKLHDTIEFIRVSSSGPARLFVYGTLKTGFQNRFARLLHSNAECLGPAKIRGRLYRISWHPGLKRCTREEWVFGEVFRLRNPLKILRALDIYEGAAFRRVETSAYLETNAFGLACWVYEYVPGVSAMRRIRSGCFE